MLNSSVFITVPDVLLINLDDNNDKFTCSLCLEKKNVAKIIFRDECGKNVEGSIKVDRPFDNASLATCKLTVSIKNADGELGFIVCVFDRKYTIVNDAQVLNALKAEYIKAEMVNKYIQILNMDTEALSNLEFEEVEDDDYDKIETRPV
jgi:hypothetical protein